MRSPERRLSAFGVDPADPGIVAVDGGGAASVELDALRGLSQEGKAASLYRVGNGHVALALARYGAVLRGGGDARLVDDLDPSVLGNVSCGLIVVELFTRSPAARSGRCGCWQRRRTPTRTSLRSRRLRGFARY